MQSRQPVERRVDTESADTQRPVWIVEDEPDVGRLAAEICEQAGAMPVVFRAPLSFLLALRGSTKPDAVILDWRLANELSSGIFMATRHRYARIPVIYWTNSPESLPAMIRDDPLTIVVDKQGGIETLERALGWAFEQRTAGAQSPGSA
jgi:DNA-binding NtrC family response regulator